MENKPEFVPADELPIVGSVQTTEELQQTQQEDSEAVKMRERELLKLENMDWSKPPHLQDFEAWL